MSDLAKALVAAQSEFPAIERSRDVRVQTKTGGSYTFSYAPLDAILHTVRPVLGKHGLAVSQLLGNIDGKPALRTMLLHEGGESLEEWCPLPSNGGMSAQEFGSLVTYFRRYALVALLGIATEEDDDGNAASGNKVGADPGRQTAPAAADEAAASAPSSGPEKITEAAYQAYLEATARAREPGATPSQQVIHFGKNKGKTLGELTPRQLAWYATEWKLQDEPTEYDHRLKQAAVALNSGDDSTDFDLPF